MPKMNMIDFLDRNVKPATGCTEPIAVAYATILAYNELVKQCLGAKTDRYCTSMVNNLTISVKTDRDVFKNAYNVMIPNTDDGSGNPMTGIKIAAAMALFTNPNDGLNLLANVGREAAYEAKKLGRAKTVVVILPDRGDRYLSTDLFTCKELFGCDKKCGDACASGKAP